MADELFEVRNLFTLGNFQGAINAATKLKPSNSSIKSDRDVLLYRSYVAQGNTALVLSEAKESADAGVAAVYRLAQYLGGEAGPRAEALAEVQRWISEGTAAASATAQVVAATVLLWEGRVDDALRLLHQPVSLEAMALHVQACLAACRADLAEQQVRGMQQVDDDASVTLLASAWVALALGGDKIAEAQAVYQELSDKYGATPSLLNGLASCAMRSGKWADAERFLLDASERMGAARDPAILVDLAVCAVHTRKPPEVAARYVTQLKSLAPNHPWLVRLKEFEASFEATAAKMSAAK